MIASRFSRAALAAVFILPVACGGGDENTSARQALEDKSTLDVLEQASLDSYDPPANGQLSAEQIEMYLKVRAREKDLLKVAVEKYKAEAEAARSAEDSERQVRSVLEGMQALGSLGDVLTADIRAAQELSINTVEYQWVKGQILQAGIASMVSQMGLDVPVEEGEEPDPELEAARYNAELLKPYDSELEALQAEIDRYRALEPAPSPASGE